VTYNKSEEEDAINGIVRWGQKESSSNAKKNVLLQDKFMYCLPIKRIWEGMTVPLMTV